MRNMCEWSKVYNGQYPGVKVYNLSALALTVFKPGIDNEWLKHTSISIKIIGQAKY